MSTTLSQKVMTMLTDPSVTTVIGQRSFRMRAPEQTKAPYIVVWFPTHQRVGHLRGITNLENPIVRFDFFGANFQQLDDLRQTVIQLMASTFGSVYRFGTELYEDDTRLYHLMADFSTWHTLGT